MWSVNSVWGPSLTAFTLERESDLSGGPCGADVRSWIRNLHFLGLCSVWQYLPGWSACTKVKQTSPRGYSGTGSWGQYKPGAAAPHLGSVPHGSSTKRACSFLPLISQANLRRENKTLCTETSCSVFPAWREWPTHMGSKEGLTRQYMSWLFPSNLRGVLQVFAPCFYGLHLHAPCNVRFAPCLAPWCPSNHLDCKGNFLGLSLQLWFMAGCGVAGWHLTSLSITAVKSQKCCLLCRPGPRAWMGSKEMHKQREPGLYKSG